MNGAGPGGVKLRPATPGDLAAIARIESVCREASRWEPASCLDYNCQVAVVGGQVAGFLVWRQTAADEHEILNLGVDPRYRRSGIGKALIQKVLAETTGSVFLEVRKSNQTARRLYENLGFSPMGVRKNYYRNPIESAIVLRFQSC